MENEDCKDLQGQFIVLDMSFTMVPYHGSGVLKGH